MLRFVSVFVIFPHELFSTACENSQEVYVRVELSGIADRLLNPKELVPLIFFVEFVTEEDLHPVVGHSMSSEKLDHEDLLG